LFNSPSIQQEDAQFYMQKVKKIEENWKDKTQNTILIGDFNMNPFDPGMVCTRSFNSVCSLDIAKKMRCRKIKDSGEIFTYFYNPSWKIYADAGNHDVHGTYYYDRCKSGQFHWNNLDQALLRPSILESYNHRFEVLYDTLNFDLRKENNGVSDHYPIMLEILEKRRNNDE